MIDMLTDLSGGLFGFFRRNPWDVLHDCFDIGIVAVLIYWALVILRGTRAMQVAIGPVSYTHLTLPTILLV